jgi:hypothetical protein
LYGLEKGGGLVGKSVLVTGASGGVGLFALELARLAGARAVALVRREEHIRLVEEAGAHEVAVGEGAGAASVLGPFDLIVESVGGAVLGEALRMLAPGGTCVAFGVSGGTEATFDVQSFYFTGGASLYGFILFHEVIAKPASEGLGHKRRSLLGGGWGCGAASARPRLPGQGRVACRGVVPARLSALLTRAIVVDDYYFPLGLRAVAC